MLEEEAQHLFCRVWSTGTGERNRSGFLPTGRVPPTGGTACEHRTANWHPIGTERVGIGQTCKVFDATKTVANVGDL
jgi:hypothetical protein